MPYPRGTILQTDGRIGVVWSASGAAVTILPILPEHARRRHDVPVEALTDRLTLGDLRGSIVRVAGAVEIRSAAPEMVGTISAGLLAALEREVAALVRASAETERWEAERRHRYRGLAERAAV